MTIKPFACPYRAPSTTQRRRQEGGWRGLMRRPLTLGRRGERRWLGRVGPTVGGGDRRFAPAWALALRHAVRPAVRRTGRAPDPPGRGLKQPRAVAAGRVPPPRPPGRQLAGPGRPPCPRSGAPAGCGAPSERIATRVVGRMPVLAGRPDPSSIGCQSNFGPAQGSLLGWSWTGVRAPWASRARRCALRPTSHPHRGHRAPRSPPGLGSLQGWQAVAHPRLRPTELPDVDPSRSPPDSPFPVVL
jgi:hypothetical protein